MELKIISGGVPKTLVEIAARKKREAEKLAKREHDSHLTFDQVWCVFDIDEHPFVSEAKQQAVDNGIRVAVSNPCFELWALLHFQDQTAHIDRHAVQKLCKGHMPGYEKQLPYKQLRDRYEAASERAVRLSKMHLHRGTAGANPSTTVSEVVATFLSQRANWR